MEFCSQALLEVAMCPLHAVGLRMGDGAQNVPDLAMTQALRKCAFKLCAQVGVHPTGRRAILEALNKGLPRGSRGVVWENAHRKPIG
jgi:hypothetical protein